MAIPRWVAGVNRRMTNRVLGPLATRLPGFGVIRHAGRRSGRRYRTPVNVFAAPDGYVVALTYGADSDWVRNVLAADGCELETRGRVVRLTSPRLFHDPARRRVPRPVGLVLGLAGVDDFLSLAAARQT
jgi:deazaflavin-dependent oxidoreductase (nitroreductase family)